MKHFVEVKTIRKFQIEQAKLNQKAIWFNQVINSKTELNTALLGNTWFYLNKSGKVKEIEFEPEFSMICNLNGKDAFMSLFDNRGVLTPVFQSLKELEYNDLISCPLV